ncbi:MAG: MBL fold metallo-hydrolase [Myxococcota bacterium]|nr:MBL fold metallo-hydrolase [Myxococcota bacterium]
MTELLCVGTSDAFASAGRRQSAYLVRGRGGSVLLDCGPTTGGGLASLGIDRDEIAAIAISHFHADHFAGLPLLLLATHYQERRTEPLTILGPPDVEARVRRLADAMGHPIEDSELGYPLHFRELALDASRPAGPFAVTAFETHHSPASHPHGLVVEAEGRRVVYSGDTGWFDALPGHAGDADLFLCECTFPDPRTPFHMSLEELDRRRHEFRAGRMLLTHLGQEMRELADPAGFERADDGARYEL